MEEIIENLKQIKGRVRGSNSQSMVSYLRRIGKKEYLPKIQSKLKEYEFKENLNEIDPLKWYPIGFEVALIFSIKEILNWGEEDIKELGRNIPKISFIVRLMTKYFLSPQKSYQKASTYWKKHFDFGIIETPEFNQKEKYFILRIKDFNLSPLYCVFLAGFFETMASFVIKSKKFWSEETKCSLKGNLYHEFKVHWE